MAHGAREREAMEQRWLWISVGNLAMALGGGGVCLCVKSEIWNMDERSTILCVVCFVRMAADSWMKWNLWYQFASAIQFGGWVVLMYSVYGCFGHSQRLYWWTSAYIEHRRTDGLSKFASTFFASSAINCNIALYRKSEAQRKRVENDLFDVTPILSSPSMPYFYFIQYFSIFCRRFVCTQNKLNSCFAT